MCVWLVRPQVVQADDWLTGHVEPRHRVLSGLASVTGCVEIDILTDLALNVHGGASAGRLSTALKTPDHDIREQLVRLIWASYGGGHLRCLRGGPYYLLNGS